MVLFDVTRKAVLSAMAEHDQMDPYNLSPTQGDDLLYQGKGYDPKTIMSLAHRHVTGTLLHWDAFTGGGNSVVRHLYRLGFTVLQSTRHEAPFISSSLLQTSLQEVLNLAPEYSSKQTPAMELRDQASKYAAETIRAELPVADTIGHDERVLRVEVGGRRADYSPVPWIRIYSARRSPSATQGFYLAYLFAADGSRVYLSLNQGTSELRAGKMRPINDRDLLRSSAAQARASLIGVDGTAARLRGHVRIDLAASSQSVGPESMRRIRNYEDANVLALEYLNGSIPEDNDLFDDLAKMLPLLAQLYRFPPPTRVTADEEVRPLATAARDIAGQGQGRELDAATRTAIELHAEDHAVRHWEGLGWTVQRVGHLKKGYDLECRHPDGGTLHVEVKGTRSLGQEVILTRNEVDHTRPTAGCPAQHALYVVSEIVVTRSDSVTCSGGRARRYWPWQPADEALTPTEYAYRVPSSQRGQK